MLPQSYREFLRRLGLLDREAERTRPPRSLSRSPHPPRLGGLSRLGGGTLLSPPSTLPLPRAPRGAGGAPESPRQCPPPRPAPDPLPNAPLQPPSPPARPVSFFHPFANAGAAAAAGAAAPLPLIESSDGGRATLFGSCTMTHRKSPGTKRSSSSVRSSSVGAGSVSITRRGAGELSVPGSPRMSREYTVPSSFWAMRPRLAESAKTARKEYRARGCLYSALAGAVERRVVNTSRSVASFLRELVNAERCWHHL